MEDEREARLSALADIETLLDRRILTLGGRPGRTMTLDGEPVCSELRLYLDLKGRLAERAQSLYGDR